MSKDWLIQQMDGLYFNGLPFEQCVQTGEFLRLQEESGEDLSLEFAILAMMVLSENYTSTLYYGVIHHLGDDSSKYHAWVEYRKNMRWYVVDLSCGYPCEFVRADYFSGDGYGKNIEMIWKLNYNSFWNIYLADYLWAVLHFKELSSVMQDLTEFRLRGFCKENPNLIF